MTGEIIGGVNGDDALFHKPGLMPMGAGNGANGAGHLDVVRPKVASDAPPAEKKLAAAKEVGLEEPINLAPVWDVDRGVAEMMEWPEKLTGYRELLFYVFFFVIYAILMIMQVNPADSYAVNSSLRSLVGGYADVKSQDDWWTYTDNLLANIFTPTWYNGDRFTTSDNGYIQYYNKLVGGVQIIQMRGLAQPCAASLYTTFYGDCHTDIPQTGNFTTSSAIPVTYQYDEDQGGYSKFFSVALTQQQVASQLADLKKSLWLDKNTRKLTIKFAVYNGEYEIFAFAAVQMTFGTGGVMFGNNKAEIQSARMEIYKKPEDWGRLALEVLFIFMAAWLFSDEMIDFGETVLTAKERVNGVEKWSLVKGLREYFSSMWNYLDLLNHGLVIAFIVFRIGYVVYVFKNPIKLPTNKYQEELEIVSELQQALLLINVLNIFVKILHLFKYFAFQPRMNILSTTVAFALPDLFHFFILYGCVFLSYSVMGILLFGPHLESYSSIGLVTQTLAELMIGQLDFQSIHEINPLMATLMFWSYVLLVMFVLVNVFLAILIDAYAEAKQKSANASGIPDDIGRWFITTFSRKPSGARGDPLKDALFFFQKRGIKKIETVDLEWFLREKYGVSDPVFLAKNEGLLRAMQCLRERDDPNCEMNQLLQNAWSTYDKDGSGFLDRTEFAAFLADAPIKLGEEQSGRIDELLIQADKNQDGVVSFDEFVPIFHAVMLESLALSAKRELDVARQKAKLAQQQH